MYYLSVCVCVYLVSVWPSKGDPTSIFYVVTDQCVATGVLQGLLDMGRLIADDVDHKLGSTQFSQFLVCWLDLA